MLADPGPVRVGAAVQGRLAGILAGHLLSAPRLDWPGADGLSVGDVVAAAYPAAVAAGLVPGAADLARLYPDLADAIAAMLLPRVDDSGRSPLTDARPRSGSV
ncbi:MAG TPA: hypothetical protein VKD90_22920 [Gemmataceae bacterium]|nr:hypothetical protein [Gemmataceae bacterium]